MIQFQDLKLTNERSMPAYMAAAERVLRSGRYINGPEVEAFESLMASTSGVRFCVAVSNGLDALRLILQGYKALGRLNDGDEVIVPANTFIATFLAVTASGLVAVPADVEESNFCLDFSSLPLSSRTRAVIPVHLYGNPCWNPGEVEKLREKGILIIEDNAQAVGASIGGVATGALGDAAAVSFYPAKNIGAFGDAGAVLTNDEALASVVRSLANYGAREKYHHELCGFNCRMDELQAALLSVKLAGLHEIVERRNHAAHLYDSLITNPEIIKPNFLPGDTVQVWHQYVIRHPRRDSLREYLAKNGIGTEIHYPVPCHKQKCYENSPDIKIYSSLLTAELLASQILSLPVADVSDNDIKVIANVINNHNG